MPRFRWCPALILAFLPVCARAQGVSDPPAPPGVLILEHRFVEGTADTVTIRLEHRVMYWAAVSGQGVPEFTPARRYHQPALVVPVESVGGDAKFEVHSAESGIHYIRLTGVRPGGVVTIRVYRDDDETERVANLDDREFAVGLSFGGGVHSGYRLDPTGGAVAERGYDAEGCLLADTGHWFSTCIGAGRQTLQPADLTVTWFFLEPRARLYSGHLFGGHRLDLGTSLRFAQGLETGPRHISPSLLGVGVYAVQHLHGDMRQRGWGVYAAWQHGRLGAVPETEDRDTDRFTGGLQWVP